MTENLAQYLVKTGKEPPLYTLDFGSHSVQIQNTFAEMFLKWRCHPKKFLHSLFFDMQELFEEMEEKTERSL